jgi:hypothetical protein
VTFDAGRTRNRTDTGAEGLTSDDRAAQGAAMTLGASSSSLTPLTLQAVAAIVFLAVVLTLLAGLLYLLLAGSVAWALMLLQGLLWLAFQVVRNLWSVVRRHVRRAVPSAAQIGSDPASDLVLYPFH